MEPSDLTFFTCKDLIDELMRRETFLGVVVHTQNDFKEQRWMPEQVFKVHFNANLDAAQVSRLLGRVSTHIDHNHC